MKVSRSALLPFSASQMYDIVMDVRVYPEFLNWCSSVEILGQQGQTVEAAMHIRYGKLAFAFTTEITSVIDRQIDLSLIEGPFKQFSGQWRFTPLQAEGGESGCKTSLNMNFEFDQGLASLVFGKMFEKIASAQLESFQQRAHEIYGVSESIK